MSDITSYFPSTSVVSGTEIYDNSIYNPSTDDTLEILNGGLNSENYGDADRTITAAKIQPGTFARGMFTGSDRWNFNYARMTAKESSLDANWMSHTLLSTRFFVPWDSATILYGYQSFFRHEATQWKPDAGSILYNEEWYIQVLVDGDVQPSMLSRLPPNRSRVGKNLGFAGVTATSPATANNDGDPGVNSPGLPRGDRWKFSSKTGMMLATTKGYHTIQVRVWVDLLAPDAEKAKVISTSGGLYVLALRN